MIVSSQPRRVAIIKWDRLGAEFLRAKIGESIPQAEIALWHHGNHALAGLRALPVELALVGLTLPDMDGLDLVPALSSERLARRVLVISSRQDERAREFMRDLRVDGFFDSLTEDPGLLPTVIQLVAAGGTYFSPAPNGHQCSRDKMPLHRLLSPTELQVFVIIGGGADEQSAADRLGISPHTVHTHVQHIMRKIGVQTRIDLVRAATSRGFVRFTADRVVYPGMEHTSLSRSSGAKDITESAVVSKISLGSKISQRRR
jgi:DNA-binding NarL/FixJ family response regulator